MTCPTCQTKTAVIETIKIDGGIKRIRKCDRGHKFATEERPSDVQPIFHGACPATGLRKFKSVYSVTHAAAYGRGGREPVLCEHCNAWHLTSVTKTDRDLKQT